MKIKSPVFIFSGVALILAALLLSAYNLHELRRAERDISLASACLETAIASVVSAETPEESTDIELPDYILNPDMDMPVESINGIDYIGLLSIPSLELELPIISQWSYPSLKLAPCRYSGSAYSGSFIIAGHNYTSHFGKLKELSPGDSIDFTDADGNRFFYTVEAIEQLEASAVAEMESEVWDLTLFTCTIGGQSRVAVRCLKNIA